MSYNILSCLIIVLGKKKVVPWHLIRKNKIKEASDFLKFSYSRLNVVHYEDGGGVKIDTMRNVVNPGNGEGAGKWLATKTNKGRNGDEELERATDGDEGNNKQDEISEGPKIFLFPRYR